MKEKLIKCRREHDCYMCEESIKAGEHAVYSEQRSPVYDKEERQIGITYSKWYKHLWRCDLTAEERFACQSGKHKLEKEYSLYRYDGCHRIYAPTGKDYCTVCGFVI